MSTADRLDWTAKLSLLTAYRARGLEWDHPTMAVVDIQYHDIDPVKGLYNALVRTGRMRTLVPADDVAAAAAQAPTDTRAWLRGEVARRFSGELLAANWDTLVLDTPYGASSTTRVLLADPLQGTAEQLQEALADVDDAAGLVRVLGEIIPGSLDGVDC